MPAARSSTRRRQQAVSPFATLRGELGMSRAEFGRLLGYSERSLAEWESGRLAPGEPALRLLRQLERIHETAARVMKKAYVREWLLQPNAAFEGLKPIELVERGEVDRVWKVLFAVESGTPL